jgi:hypothetical protein
MKKVTGIVFAMVMLGVLLSGCYSKSCDQPAPQPYSMKGEG